RRVLKWLVASAAFSTVPSLSSLAEASRYAGVAGAKAPAWFDDKLLHAQWQASPDGESLTPFRDATHYNNFYEFGPDKGDPARHAAGMVTEPWTVTIDGEVERPGQYSVEDLFAPSRLQERIYRLRCVEAWSMVIPWLGIPLAELIERLAPTSAAKYVRFETLARPEQLPGMRAGFSSMQWAFVEGVGMYESVRLVTSVAVGMYGRVLPNKNGAPLRLALPRMYSVNSIKSRVRSSFVREQPKPTWQAMA